MLTVTTGDYRADERTRELINEVLDSGRIGYGEKSKEFEKRFADLHACQYAILSNSGTSSLHVALQAMKDLHGWNDGDKAIVPATTFVATPNIVRHNKMIPTFVDIDPYTFNIDESQIVAAITKDTRVIIPVHLFGQPCNMKAIRGIARQYNLRIIEDSCEAMYVGQETNPVGSWGDIGCFSMYVAHLIVAGVGGIATTNNPDYAAKMRSLVNHGLEIENLNVDDNFSPRPMLGRRFIFDALGHSYRITEFEAAVALAQLEKIEQIIEARRRNAKLLHKGIEEINNRDVSNPVMFLQKTPPDIGHSHMMFPIVLGRGVDKTPLTQFLNQRGIETRDMLPLLNQPVYKWLHPDDFPNSKWVDESGFYVGVHQYLTEVDIQYILDNLSEYFEK